MDDFRSKVILEELRKKLELDLEKHKYTTVGSYIYILLSQLTRMREVEKIVELPRQAQVELPRQAPV